MPRDSVTTVSEDFDDNNDYNQFGRFSVDVVFHFDKL